MCFGRVDTVVPVVGESDIDDTVFKVAVRIHSNGIAGDGSSKVNVVTGDIIFFESDDVVNVSVGEGGAGAIFVDGRGGGDGDVDGVVVGVGTVGRGVGYGRCGISG